MGFPHHIKMYLVSESNGRVSWYVQNYCKPLIRWSLKLKPQVDLIYSVYTLITLTLFIRRATRVN